MVLSSSTLATCSAVDRSGEGKFFWSREVFGGLVDHRDARLALCKSSESMKV